MRKYERLYDYHLGTFNRIKFLVFVIHYMLTYSTKIN